MYRTRTGENTDCPHILHIDNLEIALTYADVVKRAYQIMLLSGLTYILHTLV
jgi:hypothetical protein